MRLSGALGLFACFTILSTPAEATRHHLRAVTLAPECNIIMPCEGAYYTPRAKKFFGFSFGQPLQSYQSQRPTKQRVARALRVKRDNSPSVISTKHRNADDADDFAKVAKVGSEVIGGRPEGCPHAFCGCGASLHIFGKIIPELNLAVNWLRKFPHVSPDAAQPGMAAANRHHVLVLESHVRGNIWLAHDSNSGGGKTRLHAVSIAPYTVVDPRQGKI